MKTGKSLIELATEVDRQAALKKDFIAPTTEIAILPDGNTLQVGTAGQFKMNNHVIDQIGTFLEIPSKHFDRLRSHAPHLLSEEANFFLRANPQPRMVRTMDGNARALKSNRHRRLDNFDLMQQAVLPRIVQDGTLQIASSEITESRLYLKSSARRRRPRSSRGFCPGRIRGSELRGRHGVHQRVGLHRSPGLHERYDRHRVRPAAQSHWPGQRSMEESFELYSDLTLQLDDVVFFAKISDTVTATMDQAKVAMVFKKMRDSAAQPITGAPEKVVEELAQRYSFNEAQTMYLQPYRRWHGMCIAPDSVMQSALTPRRIMTRPTPSLNPRRSDTDDAGTGSGTPAAA